MTAVVGDVIDDVATDPRTRRSAAILLLGCASRAAWYPGPVFAPVVSEIRIGGEAVTQQVRIDVSASPLQPAHP